MPLQPTIHGTRYMVSAGHFLATQAGFDILEAGGNAVDAGVAAGMALGIVHSDMVQFAGVAALAPVLVPDPLPRLDRLLRRRVANLLGVMQSAYIPKFVYKANRMSWMRVC